MFLKCRALLLLALLMALLGCGQNTAHVPILTELPEPPVLHPGQRFAILLNADRLSGQTWRLATPLDGTCVRFTGFTWVFPPNNNPDHPIATETWQFQAVGAGTVTIQMEYVRVSDPTATPLDTRTFPVTVVP
ncbi:MAG: protease inhibitor I42 family protein [Armatimonadota bacterium]|nr:protease inhibitor I42 family protein [Armatimonadota bacterium]